MGTERNEQTKGTMIKEMVMPKTQHVVLLPVLLNGMLFTTDVNGNMAITIDGRAIRLADPIKSASRLK